MTARDQARLAAERRVADRDRAGSPDPSSPPLGEVLLAARERKGVDLFRAERDTKIRAKYLAALERNDFKDLPGPIYTKGFLRNYATYLGLDGDSVVEQWKRETGADRKKQPAPSLAPPRPLNEPRRGPVVTKGLFGAALLLLVIVGFAAYVVVQLFRFAQPPTLALGHGATIETAADATTATLSGTTLPNAVVTVQGAAQEWRVTPAANGRWSQVVPVTKGRNDFTVWSTDPQTGQRSPQAQIIVTVPLPSAPPTATPAPSSPVATSPPPVAATTLELTAPAEGTVVQNGVAVAVSGRSNAPRVVVSAVAPGTVPAPAASGSPLPSASASAVPGPRPLTLVVSGGAFSGSYALPAGRWQLLVTTDGGAAAPVRVTRILEVRPLAGVVLEVEIRDDPAWLAVWVDGVRTREYGGVKQAGTRMTIRAQRSVEVRTGNSGATYFTLNGSTLGALGRPGQPETWLFQPPAPPQRTNRTR